MTVTACWHTAMQLCVPGTCDSDVSRAQLTADPQDTVTQLCSEAFLILVPETVLLSRLQLAGAVTALSSLLLDDCADVIEQVAAGCSVIQLFSCQQTCYQ